MKSIFSIFQKGLKKTSTSLTRSIESVFRNIDKWDEETYEELEAALIAADFGVNISMRVVDDIRERYKGGEIRTGEDILVKAHDDICFILEKNIREISYAPDGKPTIILMVGVNGSGKTTTSGKLAWLWKNEGKKVMLAACDTFRAAAVEQLKLWGDKTDCHVVSAQQGADPSAVAYDATESALARKTDILLIDTAGRQHTSKGLMDELSKMRRTIDKVCPGAPHEVWLTIDASVGSNALVQAREFSKASSVTGLVLTKLDGTGKGGIAVAIAEEFNLPVFFIGLGEQPEDLQPFNPVFYAHALFGEGVVADRMKKN
jgi:fused signal recognition particle receptor